ncbi:anthranilate synthase component II [Alcaligenes sp. HPC1271]|nr:anthranilate synthase component II [Alcaligenes sp. HPC1271]
MLFMLDNYDSFTYNLVQYFGELGQEVVVRRNDQVTLEEIEALNPSHLCVSPGPKSPADAGLSVALIQHFAGKLPILGVCLGHQAIGHAFGARIIRAQQIMHGKVSPITHQARTYSATCPRPLTSPVITPWPSSATACPTAWK